MQVRCSRSQVACVFWIQMWFVGALLSVVVVQWGLGTKVLKVSKSICPLFLVILFGVVSDSFKRI